MIDLDFLKSLIEAIDESSLDSIEIERGGTRVRLSKTPDAAPAPQGVVAAPAPAPGAPAAPAAQPAAGAPASGGEEASEGGAAAAEPADEGLVEISSPMVGTFYRAPAPDAPPYVEKGDRVATGDTLCIIEAMKLMNELEAEQAGTIVEILVENGEPVEYGQVLFKVRP